MAVSTVVDPAGSRATLKTRLGDVRRHSFHEQQLEHRWKSNFHDAYRHLTLYRQYAKVAAELRRLENIVEEAQRLWEWQGGRAERLKKRKRGVEEGKEII